MPADPRETALRFEALLFEHRRIVLHVARIYAGSGDERHDLAQEICSQLWRAFPTYDETRRFSTWMYRIALNVGITHFRQMRARSERFLAWDDHLEAALAVPAPDTLGDERVEELNQLIAELDPMSRALALLYLDERPYTEIAEVLGISESNVSTKIARIKQRLRDRVQARASTQPNTEKSRYGTR
jgi:RNA polymerase sigma-70 factor (ECF subfamily)